MVNYFKKQLQFHTNAWLKDSTNKRSVQYRVKKSLQYPCPSSLLSVAVSMGQWFHKLIKSLPSKRQKGQSDSVLQNTITHKLPLAIYHSHYLTLQQCICQVNFSIGDFSICTIFLLKNEKITIIYYDNDCVLHYFSKRFFVQCLGSDNLEFKRTRGIISHYIN